MVAGLPNRSHQYLYQKLPKSMTTIITLLVHFYQSILSEVYKNIHLDIDVFSYSYSSSNNHDVQLTIKCYYAVSKNSTSKLKKSLKTLNNIAYSLVKPYPKYSGFKSIIEFHNEGLWGRLLWRYGRYRRFLPSSELKAMAGGEK